MLNSTYIHPELCIAEICIANPEATQHPGFIKFLEFDCLAPLPTHLLAQIEASWDTKTYRFTLEARMAEHHARHSEAVFEQLHVVQDAVEGIDQQKLRTVWQQLNTVDARYQEAYLLLAQDRFVDARTVVLAIPDQHKLQELEIAEHALMLDLIDRLESLSADGRYEGQLTETETLDWEASIDGVYDRPSTYISDLLCFYYERCRSPLTGAGDGGPKRAPTVQNTETSDTRSSLSVHPNPANAWTIAEVELSEENASGELRITDALGRNVFTRTVTGKHSSSVLDLQGWEAGVYFVELRTNGTSIQRVPIAVQ